MVANSSELRRLQRRRTLVRLHRGSALGHVDARIVGVSSRLVALAIVGEGVRPDGFRVVRRADVTELEAPAPYADFLLAAMKLRGDKLARLPKLELASFRTLVETAARRFPLITVYREERDADVCHIGRPTELSARRATFLTIDPRARWDRDELLTFSWADVTRIDFGGAYEEALALVSASESA